MKAIVTGSFDPMTIGHYELVRQASEKFDKVYVVALVNANKTHMFSLEQRKRIIELSTKEFENVMEMNQMEQPQEVEMDNYIPKRTNIEQDMDR